MNRNKLLWCSAGVALLFSWSAWATGTADEGGGDTGAAAMAGSGKYNESPMLAALVASGDLPPVDERLPEVPLVKVPPEIGRYGGTAITFAHASWAVEIGGWWHGSFTLEVDENWQVGPGVAKGYELSDDQQTFTLFLREGMNWSDGHPVTAEDFLFRYEERPRRGYRSEPIESMVAVDDYTVQITFSKPFPRIVINMANENGADWNRWLPKHFLQHWHADYNEEAAAIAKNEGFETWEQALSFHAAANNVKDPNRPTTRMFVVREIGTDTRLYERNPYWYAVDPEGNQLPYIDRVQSTQVDLETYKLKVLNGEAAIANWVSFEDFTLFKQNEAKGGYTIELIDGQRGSHHTYHVNQTHSEPVLGEVMRDIRFRRALSLAIDRDEMNETLWSGMGVPRAGTLVSSVSYYKREWGEDHPYARYDPADANRLLDEMGLTNRDRDGFRTLSNGETINLTAVQVGKELSSEGHELVKDYWEDIGIKFTLREVEGSFYWDFTSTDDYVLATRPADQRHRAVRRPRHRRGLVRHPADRTDLGAGLEGAPAGGDRHRRRSDEAGRLRGRCAARGRAAPHRARTVERDPGRQRQHLRFRAVHGREPEGAGHLRRATVGHRHRGHGARPLHRQQQHR